MAAVVHCCKGMGAQRWSGWSEGPESCLLDFEGVAHPCGGKLILSRESEQATERKEEGSRMRNRGVSAHTVCTEEKKVLIVLSEAGGVR